MKKIFKIVFFFLLLFLFIHPATLEIFRKIFIYFDPLYQLTTHLFFKKISEGLLILLLYLLLVKLFNNFFCRDVCPVGFILEVCSFKAVFKKNSLVLAPYIFFGLLILSFFAVNLSSFFDPFVFFTQLCSVFRKKTLIDTLILTSPLLLLLVLNLIEKRFWCKRLCPVGYFFNGLIRLKNIITFYRKQEEPLKTKGGLTRRSFLFGLYLLLIKLFSPNYKRLEATPASRALRPPGALPEEQFNNVCLKCGTCMQVCPTGGLLPAGLEFGASGLWTPALVPRTGFCAQFCTKCGEVCPAAAIKKISEPEKLKHRLGTANIDQKRCLCHAKEILCLICYESCPYHAIVVAKNKNGFSVPVVLEEKCLGCGKCENKCPVYKEAAIIVYK